MYTYMYVYLRGAVCIHRCMCRTLRLAFGGMYTYLVCVWIYYIYTKICVLCHTKTVILVRRQTAHAEKSWEMQSVYISIYTYIYIYTNHYSCQKHIGDRKQIKLFRRQTAHEQQPERRSQHPYRLATPPLQNTCALPSLPLLHPSKGRGSVTHLRRSLLSLRPPVCLFVCGYGGGEGSICINIYIYTYIYIYIYMYVCKYIC